MPRVYGSCSVESAQAIFVDVVVHKPEPAGHGPTAPGKPPSTPPSSTVSVPMHAWVEASGRMNPLSESMAPPGSGRGWRSLQDIGARATRMEPPAVAKALATSNPRWRANNSRMIGLVLWRSTDELLFFDTVNS